MLSENKDSFTSFSVFIPSVPFLASWPWLLPPVHNWTEVVRVDIPFLFPVFSGTLHFFLQVQTSIWDYFGSVQFSLVAQSCLTLCDPKDCSTPGFPVHHQLPEITQTHVHRVGDAIQPSHPLLSRSPPTLNLCQLQGLFQWVSSSHQVAKVLEFQLQHQSFQWRFRTDFL